MRSVTCCWQFYWRISEKKKKHSFTLTLVTVFNFVVCLAMPSVSTADNVNGRWMNMNTDHWWNDNWQGKAKLHRKKPVLVPLCPSQITLPWHWTWFFSWWLTHHSYTQINTFLSNVQNCTLSVHYGYTTKRCWDRNT